MDNLLYAFQESLRQLDFVGSKGIDVSIRDIVHGRFPAVDARQVHGAGFEPIRQICGQVFAVGNAAGAPGDKGGQLPCHILRQQQSADAGGPQQTLVAWDGQGVELEPIEVQGKVPRGLGPVQGKGDAVLGRDGADSFRVLDRTGHVGAMGHEDQPGIGTDESMDIVGVDESFCICGKSVEADLRHLQQRPHNGVVLHAADDHMVPRMEIPFEEEVQPIGVARGQDHMGGLLREAEEALELFPEGQGDQLRLLGVLVDGTIERRAHLVEIAHHGLGHRFRLREGGGGVVKIDRVHGYRIAQPGGKVT